MTRFMSFQRIIALSLAVTLAAPQSAFAENRRLSETELRQMASELAAAIGRAHATHTAREPRPEPRGAQRSSRVSDRSHAMSTESVLASMNRERRARGLETLRFDERLNAAAFDRARDMFEQGYFDHVAPDGTEPFVWARDRNYRYATIGENLAEGYVDARGVVRGWMNSPGHRANLLGRDYKDVGVAIVRGSPTGRTNGYTVIALYAREARRAVAYTRW